MADDDTTDPSPTRFVADLHHLPLVKKMLQDAGIPLIDEEENKPLGLALLTLGPTDDGKLEADTVLGFLRQRAAAERDGWVPLVGKNRDAGDGIAIESHKVMDADPPTLPGSVQILGHKVMGHKVMGTCGAQGDGPHRDARGSRSRHGRPAHGRRAGRRRFPDRRPGHQSAGDAGSHPVVPGGSRHLRPQRDQASGTSGRHRPGRRDGSRPPAERPPGRWPRPSSRLADSENPPDILNLSLGCFTYAGGPPLLVTRAISRVIDRMVVVAAAGNNGQFDESGQRTGPTLDRLAGRHAGGHLGRIGRRRTEVRPKWSPAGSWVRCTALGVDVIGDFLTDRSRCRMRRS